MSTVNNIINQNLSDQEKYLLYNTSVECYFLALLMKEPSLMLEAERMVPPAWLNSDLNRHVYDIMLYVYRECLRNAWAVKFDSMMLVNAAKYLGEGYEVEFKKVESMKQLGWIESCKEYQSRDQFQIYVTKLRDIAMRVKLYIDAREAQKAVLNPAQWPEADKVAAVVETTAGETRRAMMNGRNEVALTTAQVIDEIEMDQQLMQQHPDHLFITNCYFKKLMAVLGGGFQRRSLNVLAARTKAGKSSFLNQLAVWYALGSNLMEQTSEYQPVIAGIPVLYLDSEMTTKEFTRRSISAFSSVPEREVIRGQFSSDENTFRYQGARNVLRTCNNLTHVNIGGAGTDYITSRIRQFRRDVGNETITLPNGQQFTRPRPCFVIYDWMRPASVKSLSKSVMEYQAYGELARDLKDCADENDLPILAAIQENRQGVGKGVGDYKKYGETFISGSDRISHLASVSMSLHWASEELQGAYKNNPNIKPFTHLLSIMLGRTCAEFRGGLPLMFRGECTQFTEVDDFSTAKFVADYEE